MKKSVVLLFGLIPFVQACTSEEAYLEPEIVNVICSKYT